MEQTQSPVRGVIWMLVSGASFAGLTAMVRGLGTELPAAQSAFIRFGYGLLFLSPALVALWRAGLPGGVLPLVLGRGAVHLVAVICWFYAMARLPVAEVTAIGYLNPVLMILAAALLFGEKLGPRRIGVLFVAAIGALVILRPGMREVTPAHLSQMAAASCFAASYLFAKRLSASLGAGAIVALMSLTVTIGLAPMAWAVWVPVTPTQWAGLALVAVLATFGHYAMSRAFAVAPLTVTQPVTFLQLIWAAALGWLLFAEPVDPLVILGGAVIIGAVTFGTWAEARRTGRAVAPVGD